MWISARLKNLCWGSNGNLLALPSLSLTSYLFKCEILRRSISVHISFDVAIYRLRLEPFVSHVLLTNTCFLFLLLDILFKKMSSVDRSRQGGDEYQFSRWLIHYLCSLALYLDYRRFRDMMAIMMGVPDRRSAPKGLAQGLPPARPKCGTDELCCHLPRYLCLKPMNPKVNLS